MGQTVSTGPDAYKLKMKQEFLLGEGGYGQVFRVRRKCDKAEFAMKISIKPLDLLNNKEQQNHKNEIRVQQMIQHPFTIKIIDEFISDYRKCQNKHCIVMELVNRGSMDKVLKTRKD